MAVAYQIKPTNIKIQEMQDYIAGYWENDVWDFSNPLFDDYRNSLRDKTFRKINFKNFSPTIRLEMKYFILYRLKNRIVRLSTIIVYSKRLKRTSEFLKLYYPNISSFADIDFNKAMFKFRAFLINSGLRIDSDDKLLDRFYENLFNQVQPFFIDFYDTRDEFEKDTWDFRKISVSKFAADRCHYYLLFTGIPPQYRNMVKQYMKMRVGKCSHSQCRRDVISISLFLKFINERFASWNHLKQLSRKDMEDYFSWLHTFVEGKINTEKDNLISLRIFLEYIQKAEYEQAPLKPVILLIFKEDVPKLPLRTENDIKYIPEGVLKQLEDNLEYLTPPDCIPIVILLRATGWRISDILNLRYHNCLDKTLQGWYLCGDIQKTQVLNHRVPITDEVAAVVKSVIEVTKGKSTLSNNPKKLLFVCFTGKRKGRPPEARKVSYHLNRLAVKKNIVDDQGNLFHFKNHAFRHTKAIELINNGMNLLHVQKWMAHASPEMTLWYAKILDTTMRKSWEEATKKGLFRIDESGKLKKIDVSDIENEDVIEWEYIRHNLDAVRMPLGYCMKPKKQECHSQLNPCLTCRNLCTTLDFIPQFELEIQETKSIIERGIAHNRSVWVEKNQALLNRYEVILAVLKEGKIHHKAGKKGREYVGEERSHG